MLFRVCQIHPAIEGKEPKSERALSVDKYSDDLLCRSLAIDWISSQDTMGSRLHGEAQISTAGSTVSVLLVFIWIVKWPMY